MLNLRFKDVKRFIRAAAAHRDAAKQLLTTCPEAVTSTRGHDVVYLSGYVVECALKALYLSRRPEREHAEVQKWFREQIKHNLEALAREIQDAGVVIPRLQKKKLLRVVRPNWFTEMRYDIRAWGRVDAERVLEAAELIFKWVSGD